MPQGKGYLFISLKINNHVFCYLQKSSFS